jgi:cytochrome c-type biogenesis protein CcmH/NrfG
MTPVPADPNSFDAWVELGRRMLAAGREAEAIRCFESAARLRPEPGQHLALANHLLRLGRASDAAVHFEQALRLAPADVSLRCRISQTLLDVHQPEAAETVARDALRLDPASLPARLNLAIALLIRNRLEESIEQLQQILAHDDRSAVANSKLGQALARLGRFDEAEAAARRAIKLEPNSSRHWADLAKVLFHKSSAEEALAAARRGIALNPDDFVPHTYAGQALLRLGRWEEGWAEHEWRLRAGLFTPLGLPTWDGAPLGDRSILLQAEQGFGDGIQFIRYASQVRQRCGRVIVRCHPWLKDLLATAEGVDEVITLDQPPPPEAAAAIWTMSLPHRFGTIPAEVPYLRHNPARTQKFRSAIGADETRLKVGLVWKGNPTHPDDRLRSMRFATLAPLILVPGVRFFSLQKDPGPDSPDMPDLARLCDDFADLAAAMSLLDLVITVDTAAAHLAGALGKPVWTMLAHPPEWRWMEQRTDSPWYPTMRLFRQSTPGDWSNVARDVAAALRDRVNSKAR